MLRDIPGQAGYEQPVFSFHDGVTAEIVCVGETTDATHYVYRHDMTFYGTSVPRTNDWHKFKIQYDGTVYKLYVDGTNVYTSPAGEGSPKELSAGNWWLLTTLFYWDDIRVRKFASPEPIVLAGPVAEYHFNGDANDSSGNGNNGTINGGATFVQGVSGQALSFDGVDHYVRVPDSNSLDSPSITNKLTIEAWIKTSQPGGGPGAPQLYVVESRENYGGGGYYLNVDTELIQFWVSFWSAFLQVDKWYQIVGTYDGSKSIIYVDGVELANGSYTGIIKPSNGPLYIGTSYWSSERFNGAIDEVRIYDRALSAEEINQQYETLASNLKINGTVRDSLTKAGISGVRVSTNTSISTITNESGFYSLPVTDGTYNLTASFEPKYYPNNTLTVTTSFYAVVVQNIELVKKPTGNITGSVTNV